MRIILGVVLALILIGSLFFLAIIYKFEERGKIKTAVTAINQALTDLGAATSTSTPPNTDLASLLKQLSLKVRKTGTKLQKDKSLSTLGDELISVADELDKNQTFFVHPKDVALYSARIRNLTRSIDAATEEFYRLPFFSRILESVLSSIKAIVSLPGVLMIMILLFAFNSGLQHLTLKALRSLRSIKFGGTEWPC